MMIIYIIKCSFETHIDKPVPLLCVYFYPHTHTHTHTHPHTHTHACRVQETDARERAERQRAEEEAWTSIDDEYGYCLMTPIPPPPSLMGLPPPLVYEEVTEDYEYIESLVIDTGMATVKVRSHTPSVCVSPPTTTGWHGG